MPNAGSSRRPPVWPALPPLPGAPPVPPLDVPAALVPAPPTGEPAVPPVAIGSASSVTQPKENKTSEAHSPPPIGKKDRLAFMVLLLSYAPPGVYPAARSTRENMDSARFCLVQ